MHLNILTFNWHEPYICHLTRLGHTWLVVSPETHPGQFRHWDIRMRSLPDNAQILTPGEALARLEEGTINLAVAHNVKDMAWLQPHDLPKICVFHCRLSTEIALSQGSVVREEYLERVTPLLEGAKKVFISKSKHSDWGLPGVVIEHGIDVQEYAGYNGRNPVVLRVGNLLKEMDLARGFTLSERILEGLPQVTLGLNPSLPQSRLSSSFQDLVQHYRECRVYLNTTPQAYEDGYNLSLLEAMAVGMPVVSTAHPTSPIVDGENGFAADDVDYLQRRIRELLDDQELACRIGQNARETVRRQFPMSRFLERWRQTIEETLKEYLRDRGFGAHRRAIPFHQRKKKNILMDFVAHPATTAYYLERAFRKSHNVVTCGAHLTQEVIQQWNLQELRWPLQGQDCFRNPQGTLQSVLEQLPKGWRPDFYLYVESGLGEIPPDLSILDIPKACYLIDTHLHLPKHLEIAKNFDVVFLAQRAYMEAFGEAGFRQVHWLPLACDPEIHGKQEVDKRWEVGFVGSIISPHTRRQELLASIGKHFNLKVDRKFMDEMARVFCQSHIVFNNAIKNDLNMRVFEALCSGSLLITDDAAGLDDFFQDRTHLVKYQDAQLIDLIRHYLEHPGERERIAAQGRKAVLASHTYQHRADEVVATLDRIYAGEDNSSLAPSNETPLSGDYYHHVRRDLIPLIPENAQCILEIGCGAGNTGGFLKKDSSKFVAGVELNPEAAAQAGQVLDDVIVGNIETLDLPYSKESFDCIICADVLEHLVEPLAVLKKIKPLLKPRGTLVASIPNVQFFGLIHHLAEGNWTYQDEGILDRTHLRFFTFNEIERLFAEAEMTLGAVKGILDPQYAVYEGKNQTDLKVGRVTISGLSQEELKRFFVFQYLIAATPIPTVDPRQDSVPEEKKKDHDPLMEARALEEKGRVSEALVFYEEITRRYPGDVDGWLGQGRCHLRQAGLDQARISFSRAVDLGADRADGHLGLGLVAVQGRDFKTSRHHFQKVLHLEPRNDRAWCGLALILHEQGRLLPALKFYHHTLEL
ncbi:MAG: glycosyltransferase, partial [Nitrospinaceae bacterium]